jgi:putative hemolysin
MDWFATLPIFAAIAVLMTLSGFFSASEAALFYLRDRELRQLARGGPRQLAVVKLLETPERVLSAILFCNLLVNMATFALTSMISLRLEDSGQTFTAVAFAVGSLFSIIFFSEMLPKCIAVLTPQSFAVFCAGPISLTVRMIAPLLPALNAINAITMRLVWPGLRPEPYLALSDLERAVQMSGSDTTLDGTQQRALENIVSLADRRIDEWMRPTGSLPRFTPPLTIDQLRERSWESPYVLISEPDSDEIAKSLWLPGLTTSRQKRLDALADPVIYVPWCTSVAAVVEKLAKENLQVAAVVNEHGQTIGVMTLDDILDTIFTTTAARDADNTEGPTIRLVEEGKWEVSGLTSMRLLGRELGVRLPESRNVTVRGVIQEVLQRIARPGDTCRWGRLEFTVTDAPLRGRMRVLTSIVEPEER